MVRWMLRYRIETGQILLAKREREEGARCPSQCILLQKSSHRHRHRSRFQSDGRPFGRFRCFRDSAGIQFYPNLNKHPCTLFVTDQCQSTVAFFDHHGEGIWSVGAFGLFGT